MNGMFTRLDPEGGLGAGGWVPSGMVEVVQRELQVLQVGMILDEVSRLAIVH